MGIMSSGNFRFILKNGHRVLQQLIDGTWLDVQSIVKEAEDEFSSRFANTVFKPTDYKPMTEGSLRAKTAKIIPPKELPEKLYRDQAVRSYMKLHGLLIKVLGGEPDTLLEADRQIIIKDSAFYEILNDLIKIAGDPWPNIRHLVVLEEKKK